MAAREAILARWPPRVLLSCAVLVAGKREEATELLQSLRNVGEGMDYGYPAPI